MKLDLEQMCCYLCGYIANIDEAFEITTLEDEEEEWPICPKCEGDNVGGYSSYNRAYLWQEEDMEWILKLNRINWGGNYDS